MEEMTSNNLKHVQYLEQITTLHTSPIKTGGVIGNGVIYRSCSIWGTNLVFHSN